MAFDYEADTEADVSSVVDAIRSNYRLAPLTDEQKAQRRTKTNAWRKQQAFMAELRKAEREWVEAEQAAEARAKAAAELAEHNRKVRLEQQKRDQETRRDQQLVGLQVRARQAEVWQSNVETAVRSNLMQRQRQSILTDLHNHFHPPPPPEPESEPEPEPESPPEPKIGDPDFFEKWRARSPLRSWPLRTWR
jgi:hypothetical protein